ncbi:complex I subunit 1/NuoH family protein [Desulfobulbus oligotrophicus]|jgi:NADH-quinone oxidoreductase subunit H|uniref:NADH-quinone oxidoreductase subunit H n=1 Tax=Desulfobulbus oligotrophicus TaxID=1909699 RepID=A0A7T5VES9_9BACT|nr:complex I subunit 1 family protein [Desulfobulbus oligotrophicus]MDY0389801.1 NADH-quinone oxidoreductase subunit H [Desulfobulbus oligotrophicus]QQG66559.1 NADH-quinone oxidoreductase subunit H [Desulfobulbus oligotrophicus]
MSQLDILLLVLRVAFGALVPLCFIAVLVWMERRGAGFIQDRSGPNRANIFGFRAAGLVQNLADAIKLITKEDIIPDHVRHRFYFVLAPVIVFFISLLSFAAIPFADILVINGKQYIMQAIPTDLGILWFLAIAGFAVYGIILAGWSSHNKYGMLGGLRAAAQVISYEIPLVLAVISALIVYGTVNLTEITQYQGQLLFGFIPMWGIVLQPLGAIIFIVAAFAESNRIPFDFAEGESELVAGFHVEYSSMKFGMFFMGEYVAMFTSSAIIVTLYFGGYQIPWFTTETLVNHAGIVSFLLMLIVPAFAFLFSLWMQKNNKRPYAMADDPNIRETAVYTKLLWIVVGGIEVLLLFFMVLSAGAAANILVALLQIATFLIKTTIMCFVYVWVRWTLPRFRYDQLQRLGWQTLLPLSLLNIFVTSAVVVALS